jgi:polyhydroxyalkanoate synthesis repressor PhaR
MAPRLIKKYPNRRLYDTQASAYITLSNVKAMIVESQPVRVLDAKTDEDITRSILLQIILEEEAGGQPIFSELMLQQIVRFYGHAMQSMMGSYLEKTLEVFVQMQDRLADQAGALSNVANFAAPAMPSADQWGQFMGMQAPMMQGFMSNYMEQSKNLFVQMQEQLTQQTANLWPGFPFPAGTVNPATEAAKKSTEKASANASANASSRSKPARKSSAKKSGKEPV